MQVKKKTTRLSGYDYSTDGYYFLTNNTNFSQPLIKEKIKEIIKEELLDLEKRFTGVSIYYYCLMPTHIHVILSLSGSRASIPHIWQVFKSKTTVKLNKQRLLSKTLWQRNYFEHVIRNEKALEKIVIYLRNNPFKEGMPLNEIYGDRIPKLEI